MHDRLKRRPVFLLALVVLASAVVATVASGETCCRRLLAMMPTAMPANQDVDLSGFIEGAVIGPMMDQTLGLTKGMPKSECPDIEFYDIEAKAEHEKLVDAIAAAHSRQKGWPAPPPTTEPPEWDMDYIFRATLVAEHVDGKSERVCGEGYEPGTQDCYGGNLLGTFTFTLQLVDHHHQDTVLKEGSVSWNGSILEGLGWWRPGGADGSPIRQVVNDFLPLQDLIIDYERIPETGRVTVPNDTVQAGEPATISVTELRTEDGRPTQPWQRILVKVEKGKILNGEQGEEVEEGYSVLRAGKGTVQYQPPPGCKPDKETLTVHNTCNKKETGKAGSREESLAKKELAKKEFDIVCDQWDVTITYSEDVGGTYDATKGHRITVKRSYSGTFKARVKLLERDGRTTTYESKDSEVEIHDNYNHHSVMEECAWRGGFNGDKSGRVPIEVSFRLNSHNHTYHVGLGKWNGDGTTYTLGGNLFGTLQGCSGAWQREVRSITLPRGWEKGEGPPSSRTWSPGQTSFTFQTSWDDYGTGIWPKDCGTPAPTLPPLAKAANVLMYVPLVFDWGKHPQMKIKKSLSWEITRPK